MVKVYEPAQELQLNREFSDPISGIFCKAQGFTAQVQPQSVLQLRSAYLEVHQLVLGRSHESCSPECSYNLNRIDFHVVRLRSQHHFSPIQEQAQAPSWWDFFASPKKKPPLPQDGNSPAAYEFRIWSLEV